MDIIFIFKIVVKEIFSGQFVHFAQELAFFAKQCTEKSGFFSVLAQNDREYKVICLCSSAKVKRLKFEFFSIL